jgi:hypothetical protein
MMMRKIYGLAALLFLGLCAFTTGDTKDFPAFRGVTLSGKSVSLPDPANKKYTFIGVAYSMEAQDPMYTWAQPVYDRLVDNPMFPVNTYFVAMTGKIKLMSQDKIKAKMKENLDPELYKYVVVYQDNPQQYIEALEMDDKQLPYFFVIDPKGKITYSTSGEFDEDKFEKVTDALSE